MEVLGGGKILEYSAEDECPHEAGPGENWQESVVLIWWDAKNAIGGYCRIGHEPNRHGGESVIWTAVFTPDHAFHRSAGFPLAPGDRTPNGFAAGNGASRFEYDGHGIWRIREPGLDLTLHLEDFHPAIDGYVKNGTRELSDVSSNHVEVSCRVTGRLVAQGKEYDIDGLGTRDHGWGRRDWGSILAHRWTVGTIDKDNSFCAVAMHLSNDTIAKFGWVVRGDKVIYADKVEIIAYLSCDGASNVGGRTLMTLSTGEKYELLFDPVAPAAMFNRHGVCCVDTLSRVTWGDQIGYGVFETSTNPQAGTRLPKTLDRGINGNGWQPNPFTNSTQRG